MTEHELLYAYSSIVIAIVLFLVIILFNASGLM